MTAKRPARRIIVKYETILPHFETHKQAAFVIDGDKLMLPKRLVVIDSDSKRVVLPLWLLMDRLSRARIDKLRRLAKRI
jgi:hypothetical protein